MALAQTAALKIGVIDYSRLIEDSPQAKAVQQSLQGEFAPRQRELQTQQNELKTRQEKFERESAVMSEDQRSKTEKGLRDSIRDFQRKQTEFQEDFNGRRNEEIGRLQKTVLQEAQVYAKAQGYDLVIADGVIYAKDTLNITAAVLSVLQSKAKPAAAAPAAEKKP